MKDEFLNKDPNKMVSRKVLMSIYLTTLSDTTLRSSLKYTLRLEQACDILYDKDNQESVEKQVKQPNSGISVTRD